VRKEKIVIFGAGDIAQIAKYYFDIDSSYQVVAFTVNIDYKKNDTFEGLPLVAFENIVELYPPSVFKLFIALSYSKLNKIREQKYHEAKSKGYTLVSYISSKCTYLSQYDTGDNCFIFEDNTIQPFVKIGDNVTLWSGNHIGHHSVIDSHNFISSHVVISGHCYIKSNCFLGVNATLHNNVTIEKGNIIAAGSIISKNTGENQVYLPARTILFDKSSDHIKI
jgi:sugar O-acyltransferase (sialic acid O-acetyltransferase NeuD family)